MSNFTSFALNFNSGTDASPTWNTLQFGTANHELRLCGTGAGGGSIASASWPIYAQPTTVTAIPEMWAYTGSDNSGGIKVATYDGTTAHYMQFRLNWDNTGTFASAPIISAWKDNTYPAAVAGSQPGTGDGSSVINGQTTDTSSTSYLKGNAYGQGLTSGGVQQTPGSNAGGTLAATSGSAGAATPGSAAWLATWQSLMSATQYIQNGGTPQATTAGLWYFVLAEYAGPNETAGTLIPVIGVQYSWI